MYQFFESIRVVNGRVMNLKFHQQRIDRCYKSFGLPSTLNLKEYISNIVLPKENVFKLRISYNVFNPKSTNYNLSLYQEKTIQSLICINTDTILYQHKSENRDDINNLYKLKSNFDDILIIKNGLITDTSYCNVALYKNDHWWTPKVPLLFGTMRAKLIAKKFIQEKDILISEIHLYTKMRLFNALIPWSNNKDIAINNIHLK